MTDWLTDTRSVPGSAYFMTLFLGEFECTTQMYVWLYLPDTNILIYDNFAPMTDMSDDDGDSNDGKIDVDNEDDEDLFTSG